MDVCLSLSANSYNALLFSPMIKNNQPAQNHAQKTLSLLQFQKKFGAEKACQKQLFRLRWPEGFKCPRCGQAETYFHSKRHLYQCKSCGYQASLTAGTVFHKTRTPLTKWFWLIWLMGRQKSGISMMSMQRMLEIKTYKTVWTMGHKIRKALADRDADYKLAGLIAMDDTFFGAPKPREARPRRRRQGQSCLVAVETPVICRPLLKGIWFPSRRGLAVSRPPGLAGWRKFKQG